MKLLIDYISNHFRVDYFIWKADKVDVVGRYIAEKLGDELVLE